MEARDHVSALLGSATHSLCFLHERSGEMFDPHAPGVG
jgi:hypothetical protein